VIGFGVLGPLEAVGDRGPIALGGQKQRALLGFLLVHANEVVSTDRIIDALWGEHPPRTAATSLQNLVSNLRKAIGADRVLTCPPGYKLVVGPDELDLFRFERFLAEARSADSEGRAWLLESALALRRGEPLADLSYESWAAAEAGRLEELLLSALEDRLDAQLELGLQAEVVADLEALVREHPLRERLRGLLMLALYRCGRQAEAVAAYQETRHVLADELGIDPTPELQRLYASILRQESGLRPTAPPPDEDHHAAVVRATLAGRLVPVLGPSLAVAPETGAAPEEELVERLARAFDLPAEATAGPATACEYVALTAGVGALYDELHDGIAAAAAPGPAHRFLAGLPPLLRSQGTPHQLIVSAGFDGALEQAFADADEELDVVTYLAVGRHRGKFVHAAPGEPAVVVDEPNAYPLSLERRTVLLKIHGGVDPSADRPWESFVASEDDFIDLLAEGELTSLVPVTLAAKLRRSHFLFLGYRPVTEWSLRVFLHRVWGRDAPRYRSWAVDPAPQLLTGKLWAARGVELLAVPVDEYVSALAARLEPAVPA
jgi:DNA-binding SARP family transcriptional activator